MNKVFTNSRLVVATVNPTTEQKGSLSFSNLIEEAPVSAVQTMKDQLAQLIQDDIQTVSATVTYEYI